MRRLCGSLGDAKGLRRRCDQARHAPFASWLHSVAMRGAGVWAGPFRPRVRMLRDDEGPNVATGAKFCMLEKTATPFSCAPAGAALSSSDIPSP